MIKLFRNIRQQVLSEGKTGKYLKYAIGEIILVVIGILIALGINNWNHERAEIQQEKIALHNLIVDLEEQSGLLKTYIEEEKEFYKSGLYVCAHYARHHAFLINDTLLSKFNLLAFRRTFVPVNTTFQELVSTGSIGLIRNAQLKRRIMQHYNELERISLVTAYNNTNLVDGLYNPVLFAQTVFVHKFRYETEEFNRLLQNIREDQLRLFNPASLKNLYEASEKLLTTPERALNLFNLIQLRTQMASGQIIRYTEFDQEISELLHMIKSEAGPS